MKMTATWINKRKNWGGCSKKQQICVSCVFSYSEAVFSKTLEQNRKMIKQKFPQSLHLCSTIL